MKNVLEKGRVTAGQDVLVQLTNQLKMLGTPPLGAEFAQISGTDLNDALVIHRITNKFERPHEGKRDEKRLTSIQKMLDYDSSYLENRKDYFKQKGVVSHFLAARAWLHGHLKGFKPSYQLEFPSGESVVSNRGYVDLYYKLTTESQWTVSQSCVKQASRIAYNNRALKRVVIERFKRLNLGASDPRKRWVLEAKAANKFIGFYVFSRIFLYTVDIVGVSRLTTVPKDNKEDRVISCDPTWNLVVQRSIALGLLASIKMSTGVDIQQLQDIHRKRISDRSQATIDLSKASDSNWLNQFTLLFPKRIVDEVLKARTGIVEYDGNYHVLNQLAPMGCGFTFEIMSITLMAYARVLDNDATVFGDDIIINQKSAPRLCKTLTNLGWVINERKSFIEGNFSESCGGFYNHSTKQDIISHDLFFPETMADIIAACNKLSRILRANQIGKVLRNFLLHAYTSLLKIVPSVVYTWDEIRDGEEAEVVWVPKSIPIEVFRPRNQAEYHCDYQRGNNYGKRLVYQPSVEIRERRDDVDVVLYACYMYSGVKPIGPRTGELRWQSYQRNS